jgi:choline dehydrogenase-like flavoprotein
VCSRGYSLGSSFSTQSSTLPAARATGNLTLLTDALVERVTYDDTTKRAGGVEVLHTDTGIRRRYGARLVFLCASTLNSVGVLLRSTSQRFPSGLANSSGTLGRYLMDHASTLSARAVFSSFQDRYYFGNRPNTVLIPKFRNLEEAESRFVRGYQFQGLAVRRGWHRGMQQRGIGEAFKNRLRSPGEWVMALVAFAECLPRAENRVTLHPRAVDTEGQPQLSIAFSFGENERSLLADAAEQSRMMLEAAGGVVTDSNAHPDPGGSSIHEMGGARMGRDPGDSVLNEFNQAHDVPNLYVTDGAAMASSACQNPSLTYMALTARACEHASVMLKTSRI